MCMLTIGRMTAGFTFGFKVIRELSKSGIVLLVLISVLAGYLIGQPSELPLDARALSRMGTTLLGILFLASGSSALNQLQEYKIDALMPRTASRPIPSGRMSPHAVFVFVGLTLFFGLMTLWKLSPSLFYLGGVAVFFYNGLYTLWWKKNWAYAAVPGAIPGAIPVLMGYTSAQGQVFHPAGIYLFLVLFFWQMPHFWVLALRYRKDYESGGFPTLPVSYGLNVTVRQIVFWCLAYLGVALMAPLFLQVRWIYLVPALLMSLKVIQELWGFVKTPESQKWLHFFLWVNLSLVAYLGFAALDLWSGFLAIPHFTR